MKRSKREPASFKTNFGLLAVELVFIALIWIGIGFRFLNLGRESYTCDEVFNHQLAKESFRSLVTGRVSDVGNPPLFPILLHFWIKVFGRSDFSTRLISVFAGLAAIFVLYRSVLKIKNQKVFALAVSAVFSLSLLPILMAQELRSYSLLILITTVGFCFELEIASGLRPQTKTPAVYFLVSLAGLFTHYLYFIFFVQQFVVLFLLLRSRGERIAGLLKAFSLSLAVFLFWFSKHFLIPTFVSENKWNYDFYSSAQYPFPQLREGPSFSILSFSGALFNFDFLTNSGRGLAAGDIFLFWLILAAAVVFAFKRLGRKRVRRQFLIAAFHFLPMLVLAVLTPFGKLINWNNYYSFLLPFFAFLCCLPLAASGRKTKLIWFLVLVVFLGSSAFRINRYLQYPRKRDYRQLAEYLSENSSPSETFLVFSGDCGDSQYMISFYFPDLLDKFAVFCLEDYADKAEEFWRYSERKEVVVIRSIDRGSNQYDDVLNELLAGRAISEDGGLNLKSFTVEKYHSSRENGNIEIFLKPEGD